MLTGLMGDVPKGSVSVRNIREPTFGSLEFSALENYIIETPYFQSLHHVKQLGLVMNWFPGATHSRFAHSLAVCYFAGEAAQQIHTKQPEIEWHLQYFHWLRLAGLLHDIGHAACSHLFDDFIQHSSYMKSRVVKEMQHHESRGILLLRFLIKNAPKELIKDIIDTDEMVEVVADMIRGIPTTTTTSEEKTTDALQKQQQPMRTVTTSAGASIPVPIWLFEIVANKYSELDVDKIYLTQDARAIGLVEGVDMIRIIKTARVCPNTQHIIWSAEVVHDICKLFSLRRSMFVRVYRHAQVIKWDYAMFELLDALSEIFQFDKLLNEYQTNDHLWRLLITDSSVWTMIQNLIHQSNWVKQITQEQMNKIQNGWKIWNQVKDAKIVSETSSNDEQHIQWQNNDHNFTLSTTYAYANCNFNLASRIYVYSDKHNLQHSFPLCEAKDHQKVDIDVIAKPIKRVITYQI